MEIPGEIIEAARSREDGAAERLVALAWPQAFAIAYSIVRDRGLAEDAAQESCATVYRKVSQLRHAAAFKVWFYRTVIRQAAKLERKATLAHLFSPIETARDDIENSATRIDVLRALAKLPRKQRAAIVLSYYGGMNSREIAEVLQIADSSVRFLIMQGRDALERLLSDPRSNHHVSGGSPCRLTWVRRCAARSTSR